jgi:protein O-mannosyl-transferase
MQVQRLMQPGSPGVQLTGQERAHRLPGMAQPTDPQGATGQQERPATCARGAVSAAGLALALGALTLAVYWPVIHHEFIRFDDSLYIVRNTHVSTGLTWGNVQWAFVTGHGGNWHPLTWLSHMVDVQLLGMNAGRHHLVSVLFHCANAMVLLLLLAEITGARWRSALVAALFALHPLHIESVAWAAERKDVLSTLFFLLSLWAYVRFAQRRAGAGAEAGPAKQPGRGGVAYGVSLFCFACGLMSKPMLVTLPFVLLLLDFWPLRREELGMDRKHAAGWLGLLREKIPFFGLAGGFCVVTYLVQQGSGAITLHFPLSARIANAVASYWKYLGKTVCPMDLAIFYPHPDTRYPVSDQWPWWLIAAAGGGLLVLSLLTVLWARRRPWLLVGWFWFLGTLVPVIGLVQAGNQAMADRYTYIPLIGLFVALVWTAAGLVPQRAVGVALGASVLLGCGLVTRHQLAFWRTDATLFQHALEVTQHNAQAEYHVGIYCTEKGQWDTALAHFQAAVAADPTFTEGYKGVAMVFEQRGRMAEAIAEYERAFQAQPRDATLPDRLGILLAAAGRTNEAMARFDQAIRLAPAFAEPRYNLGILLMDLGRFGEAAEQFAQVARVHPEDQQALSQAARAVAEQGDPVKAVELLGELARVNPASAQAQVFLGKALLWNGRTNEAAEAFSRAVRLDPSLSEPLAPFRQR